MYTPWAQPRAVSRTGQQEELQANALLDGNLHSVPVGRRGKHNEIVGKILEDLDTLQDGTALRIPLESLGSQKFANVRAAVSRATKKRKMNLESASDGRYFYPWFSVNGRGKQRVKVSGIGTKM